MYLLIIYKYEVANGWYWSWNVTVVNKGRGLKYVAIVYTENYLNGTGFNEYLPIKVRDWLFTKLK